MICGLVLRLCEVTVYTKELSIHFNNLFLILLLPAIIFEAGYNLPQGPFFRNIGTILMYSFIGTFIAIFTTSGLFYAAG